MTTREFYVAVADSDVGEELITKAQELIAALDAKNAKRKSTPTKEQKEAAARAMKAEQERIEKEANEETLFGKKADIPTVEPAAPATVSGSLIGDARLHLDQLKWLLSPTLQEAVDSVHELRDGG